MGLKPSDVKELDLSTGMNETKQILLHPHFDPERLKRRFIASSFLQTKYDPRLNSQISQFSIKTGKKQKNNPEAPGFNLICI